jgi:hypothetical protein
MTDKSPNTMWSNDIPYGSAVLRRFAETQAPLLLHGMSLRAKRGNPRGAIMYSAMSIAL